MKITRGFIIRQPWANLILRKKKIWELRGSNCKIRGFVGLICEGKWVGNIEIIDSIKLDFKQFRENQNKHQVQDTSKLPYPKTYSWVIGKVEKFKTPKKYTHKNGCVIWVKL